MKTVSLAPPTASAKVATVRLGAVGWVVAIPRMSGLDTGIATTHGSSLSSSQYGCR